jgi:L-asparaginase
MNMENILIVNSGGTFNKIYNRVSGKLDIDTSSKSLLEIMNKWLCKFDVIETIGKDSLDFIDSDRELLLSIILENANKYKKIIIIHGTDTMHISSDYLDKANLDLVIVFTGAMTPYSIDSTEATANLCSAMGYATSMHEAGVYVAMNGNFGSQKSIKKDRLNGRFTS